ncbi:hypothetical protein BWK47_08060 [Synechocystis sp. CACIAM 05]|nr:hypothetical protein BWK47_08060 [Synechocystis sp. CACIAM 05]
MESERIMTTNISPIFQQTLSRQDWTIQEALIRSGSLPTHPTLIGNDWSEALKAILFSPVEMLVITGALDSFALARYHLISQESNQGTTWVSAVSDAEEAMHLSFPYTFEDLVKLLDASLDFDGASAPLDSSFTVDLAEFSVLLSVADILKTQQLEALLARSPGPAQAFTLGDIHKTLQLGLQTQDTHWWVTTGQILTPFPLVTELPHLTQALEKLVQKNFLAIREHGYLPALCGDFLGSLLMPLSSASVTLLHKTPTGILREADTVLGIRTATAFWTLNFRMGEEFPLIDVVSAPALLFLTYINELQSLYQQAAFHSASPLSNKTEPLSGLSTPDYCQACHQSLQEGDKFCTHCGAPVAVMEPPKPQTCPQCGHTPTPGAKFCGNCGFVLGDKS